IPDEAAKLFNITSKDLKIIKKVGEGSFGAVYYGSWNSKDVAIKRLTNTVNSSSISEFYREAALCLSIKFVELSSPTTFCPLPTILTTIRFRPHVNVTRSYGMCQEPNNVALVMEWLPMGSLDKWLEKNFDSLTDSLRYRLISGIASGMVR